MRIINGESKISLRSWIGSSPIFQKYYTVYNIKPVVSPGSTVLAESGSPSRSPADEQQKSEFVRVKVYNDYKLKLKSYGKKNLTRFVAGLG
jgi:hypothetical protein